MQMRPNPYKRKMAAVLPTGQQARDRLRSFVAATNVTIRLERLDGQWVPAGPCTAQWTSSWKRGQIIEAFNGLPSPDPCGAEGTSLPTMGRHRRPSHGTCTETSLLHTAHGINPCRRNKTRTARRSQTHPPPTNIALRAPTYSRTAQARHRVAQDLPLDISLEVDDACTPIQRWLWLLQNSVKL